MAIEGTERNSVLVAVDWQRLFPWLMLLRTFKVAASASALFVATAGAILTPIGWSALSAVLVPAGDRAPLWGEESGVRPPHQLVPADDRAPLWGDTSGVDTRWPWKELDAVDPGPSQQSNPSLGLERKSNGLDAVDPGPSDLLPTYSTGRGWAILTQMPRRMMGPMWRILFLPLGWRDLLYNIGGMLWTLAVWSVCGGVLTRIAVVKLGRGEQVGLFEAIGYVFRRPAYFFAPLVPQIAYVGLVIVGLLAGLLMRVHVGALFVSLVWPLLLILGLLAAIITLGLGVGWPFLWVVVSAERNGDAFEACQRSFSYAWERPLHYIGYLIVAALYGLGCAILVDWFVHAVTHFSWWAVAWGASWQELADLNREPGGVGGVGVSIITFWNRLVHSVGPGFGFSYFWVAACGVYLLLRRAVDEGMPIDQVYMPDEVERFGLPIEPDEAVGGGGTERATTDEAPDASSSSPDGRADSPPDVGEGEGDPS